MPASEERSRPSEFAPGFKDLQRDVEGYLASVGKRRRTPDGFIVYSGYDEALAQWFEAYLAQQAFDPLVSHFRRWNWEYSYNDYLLRLTDALRQKRDWPRMKRLWDGVVAKRRKLYNDVHKLARRSPGVLPPATLQESRQRLLESLGRARAFSVELGSPDDTQIYTSMIDRIQAGKRA